MTRITRMSSGPPKKERRKKAIKRGETVSVRFNLDIDALVRRIAAEAPLARGNPAIVAEMIVEDWVQLWGCSDDSADAFDQVALRVAQRRVNAAAAMRTSGPTEDAKARAVVRGAEARSAGRIRKPAAGQAGQKGSA